MIGPYIDTSALAKWYVNEPRSADFDTYMQQQSAAEISRLTVVEFRCLLARRRRAGDFDAKAEASAFNRFENDVARGILTCHALDDRHAIDALALIQRREAMRSARSMPCILQFPSASPHRRSRPRTAPWPRPPRRWA